MPPKKTNSDTVPEPNKRTKEKAPRKKPPKVKAEKPKLKIPTVVKLKLPPFKTFLSSENKQTVSPVKAKNRNKSPELSATAKRKIDLANEVALAQLNPLSKISFEEDVKKKPVKKKAEPRKVEVAKVVKKRGRPKKKQIQNADTADVSSKAESQTTEESVVVTKSKKKKVTVKKGPVKTTKKKIESSESDNKTSGTRKRKADTTSTPIVTKRKYVCKGKNLITNVSKTDSHESPSILDAMNKILHTGPEQNDTSKPAQVDSRKTSSECPSWTKDISSSSTTTTCLTVGSNEFVRIDKKLPVIKLSHVDNEWKNMSDSKMMSAHDSDSASSCSSSSSSSSSYSQSSHSARSLNLSTTSVSTRKSYEPSNTSIRSSITKDQNSEYALSKCDANKGKLDLESLNWCGYRNENAYPKIDKDNKIFRLLKMENNLQEWCEAVNNLLREESQYQPKIGTVNVETDPNMYTDKSEDDDNFITSRSKYVPFDQTSQPDEDPLLPPQVCEPSSEDDNYSQAPFEPSYNDDDDALSLYAGSINDIDSCRYNSSANSVCANAPDDEYIPQPLPTNLLYNPLTYVPSRISGDELKNYKIKSVCEKQNADSTSIYRETKMENKQTLQKNTENTFSSIGIKKSSPQEIKLIASQYKSTQGIKSPVFRGVCFYNLISNCKKIRCKFPHREPDVQEVANRLTSLSDQVFIEEYMLLRNWPDLRRRYGTVFVSLCIERNMTRLLVEMVIDFTSKTKSDSLEDTAIKINITERALMHLNNVDLSECEDLLQYDFGHRDLLCDVLMRAIGETQNFSRFKSVFIKLTNFIIGIGHTFQINVANQTLERVSILPCEKPLALAMLAIIKNTDSKIFENPMISKFEEQLSSLDLRLYEELCSLKEIASVAAPPPLQESVPSPLMSQDIVSQQLNLMQTNNKERYTSPDTTRMDSSKPQDNQTQQTVQISYSSLYPNIFGSNSSTSTESMEDKRPAKFRNWKGNKHNSPHNHAKMNSGHMYSHMGRYPRPLMMQPMRPPLIKRHMNQRHLVFGPTPPKFPRRSGPGPDYY